MDYRKVDFSIMVCSARFNCFFFSKETLQTFLRAHLAILSVFIQILKKAMDFERVFCLSFWGCGFICFWVFLARFFFFESSRTSLRQKPLAC